MTVEFVVLSTALIALLATKAGLLLVDAMPALRRQYAMAARRPKLRQGLVGSRPA